MDFATHPERYAYHNANGPRGASAGRLQILHKQAGPRHLVVAVLMVALIVSDRAGMVMCVFMALGIPASVSAGKWFPELVPFADRRLDGLGRILHGVAVVFQGQSVAGHFGGAVRLVGDGLQMIL